MKPIFKNHAIKSMFTTAILVLVGDGLTYFMDQRDIDKYLITIFD